MQDVIISKEDELTESVDTTEVAPPLDPSHSNPPETTPTDHENLENIGNATTDLGSPPSAPPHSQGSVGAQAKVSTWLAEHSQLSQIPTPAPQTNTTAQLDDTTLSTTNAALAPPSAIKHTVEISAKKKDRTIMLLIRMYCQRIQTHPWLGKSLHPHQKSGKGPLKLKT